MKNKNNDVEHPMKAKARSLMHYSASGGLPCPIEKQRSRRAAGMRHASLECLIPAALPDLLDQIKDPTHNFTYKRKRKYSSLFNNN